MPKMTQKTPAQNRADYAKAKPKQFGNLHERMKFLIQHAGKLEEATREARMNDRKLMPGFGDVWHAIWDLETEIKGHTPDEPPHGRRVVKL